MLSSLTQRPILLIAVLAVLVLWVLPKFM